VAWWDVVLCWTEFELAATACEAVKATGRTRPSKAYRDLRVVVTGRLQGYMGCGTSLTGESRKLS
jgi:hypothetical protein